METMTDRLAELLDRQEITQLVNAYARSVDLNDPDAVAVLFADDAVIDYGRGFPDRAVGPAALAETLRNTLGNVLATSHHCSNVDIWFDSPDDAHGIGTSTRGTASLTGPTSTSGRSTTTATGGCRRWAGGSPTAASRSPEPPGSIGSST